MRQQFPHVSCSTATIGLHGSSLLYELLWNARIYY